jgi:hypothetical protein
MSYESNKNNRTKFEKTRDQRTREKEKEKERERKREREKEKEKEKEDTKKDNHPMLPTSIKRTTSSIRKSPKDQHNHFPLSLFFSLCLSALCLSLLLQALKMYNTLRHRYL